MGRRRTAWLVALGLTAVGGVLAHALVYAVLFNGGVHGSHAAGAHWGFCLAVCGTLALVGFAVFGGEKAPLWLFALLPPAGFALQAQLAWALSPGSGTVALLATVTLGAFIQVPFALTAYLAARGLLSLAVALAGGRRPHARRRGAAPVLRLRVTAPRVLSRRASSGLGQRAPPAWTRRPCPN